MVFVGKAFSASIGLWIGKVQTATIDQQMDWKTSIEYPMKRTKKRHFYQKMVFVGNTSSASISGRGAGWSSLVFTFLLSSRDAYASRDDK